MARFLCVLMIICQEIMLMKSGMGGRLRAMNFALWKELRTIDMERVMKSVHIEHNWHRVDKFHICLNMIFQYRQMSF